MLTTFLLGYYIHQFRIPEPKVFREDRSYQYMQTVQPEGHLTVEVSSPKSGSVAPGAQRIEMLRMKMTASCENAVPIDTIRIQRRGLGANADIQSLYVFHRGTRVSREYAISRRDGSVDLRLRDFAIAACDSEDVSIVANYATNASPAGEHRIELQGIDARNSHVRIENVKGNFPTSMRTAANTAGQISLEYLRNTNPIRYGSRQRISRFTLEADGEDHHEISSIRFTNKGSASNADLQNIFIEFRARRISTMSPQLSGDAVTLFFDPPLMLQKNQKLKFGLRADVRASRSKTIQFVVEEPSDITATPVRLR